MSNVHDLAPEIQKRVNGFTIFLSKHGFSRPEVKNIGSLLHGMLKKRDVHVSVLGRSLEEPITPKKTEERLHRNLRRKGLDRRLLEANAVKHSAAIRRKRFCIIDVSDIQKQYATKMEGLGRVRDGDKSGRDAMVIGNGLYWINGVMADESGILPVYSEIYGLDHEGKEHTSENSKILEITDMVHALHAEAIHVMDRGGDRSSIIDCFVENERLFIIRGQDQRSLMLHQDSEKLTNIEDIAKKTRTNHSYKSLRKGEWFDVGIRRVYYSKTPLWLVVARRRRGGLSWYLTNIKGTRCEIMDTVMEGYGYRWRVEEYHRQIKQDYGLEKICLRTYNAIKNMGVLVTIAASFCAQLHENLVIRMIAAAGLLPRKRLGDIPDYPYYMITAAVAWALDQT
ncbi:MAG: transposase, partial [Bacteroidetes bacterium]|nr:transposase [Bacteroidota bacterium]